MYVYEKHSLRRPCDALVQFIRRLDAHLVLLCTYEKGNTNAKSIPDSRRRCLCHADVDDVCCMVIPASALSQERGKRGVGRHASAPAPVAPVSTAAIAAPVSPDWASAVAPPPPSCTASVILVVNVAGAESTSPAPAAIAAAATAAATDATTASASDSSAITQRVRGA